MALQEYVGEPVVEVVSIDTGAPVRVVAPGAPRTATDPDRLSIFTDGNARVVALQCG